MAPSSVTEDYYMVLEVHQTATLELITKSYRRLALKLHPDRSAKGGSTEAFQLLGLAYETLKDESKRRDYDIIYPSVTRSQANSQSAQTTRPSPASASYSAACSEVARIAALQKEKEECGVRWIARRDTFEASIYELNRKIRQLEQDINNLASIAAAETAVEARKNSWATWILSPLYKQVAESEEEKARKDRGRQERRIEKDLKERRLGLQEAQLRETEVQMEQARKDVDAANLRNDQMIRTIEIEKRNREARERRKREEVEKERLAKIRQQQQEQWAREAQEARKILRKQQAEARAAELARQEEYRRLQRHWSGFDNSSTRQSYASACGHSGWWDKVQHRIACPRCFDVWNYLLQCPGCGMKACPRCQSELRPRFRRHPGRTSRKEAPRPRSPSPFHYEYDDSFMY